MVMSGKDWVGLIEEVYRLEGDDDSWLKRLLERAAPLSKRGFWPTIGTYRYTPSNLDLERSATLGPAHAHDILTASMQVQTPAVSHFFRSGPAVTSLSETLYTREPDLATVVQQITNGVVHDKIAVKGLTGRGSALILCWLFSERIAPTAQERHRWQCVASHLGAGLRLREFAQALNLDSPSVEAILNGSGKLYEAREDAERPSARAALREAVRRLDQLRTSRARSDPDQALASWEGLVQGRWSLVDHFDSDGRRFVLAVKNDPRFPDPRGLTLRERQISEFIGQGHSCKEISYMVGISPSAVTNCTTRAVRKLGLSSLTELAAFFSPSGPRATLAESVVHGDTLLIGVYPLVRSDHMAKLTDAERAVLAAMLAGSTNRDIARRRNCSEHTVANQVQAIFRKVGARSRSELPVRLQQNPSDHTET
ncbi:MAG: LuxR C-terminal-related transcriptional regulator [Nitrospira sp.]|nr:LuxR C-terminal-related transcriptional regulator [Nitrospira sp.]